MADQYTQIDHDGPQHIDGAAPPIASLPVSAVSKTMPPQDVMDAAMVLTETCTAWTPGPLPKEPVTQNQSYVLHQDLCSLATDPVGFNKKTDAIFANGMMAAVILMALAYIVIRMVSWVVKFFSRHRERSAETMKRRLLLEAAQRKTEEISRRQAPGAAE